MTTRAPLSVTIEEYLARTGDFDAIIDARSPGEYAQDHIPGAINLPVLDDTQRAEVGTLDRQHSGFEARRRGAALVCTNIAGILSGPLADRPREFRPLVYCWRGGNRSGALATVLARTGWRTAVLEGGYRAYRRQVLAELATLPERFTFIVVAGRTGTGKSQILQRAAAMGAQILDLEALAEHRGSVLGPIPDRAQPGQKAFESRLWSALRVLDPARAVLVESESRKVGQRHLPDTLMRCMRAASCRIIDAEMDLRIDLLLREYAHFVLDPESLCARLSRLSDVHGESLVARWQGLARDGNWRELVGSLLSEHYDPAYDRSMKRNFSALGLASTIVLEPSESQRVGAAPTREEAIDNALERAARTLWASA